MTKRSVYLELLALLRNYQLRGRFISSAYDTEVSTSEIFALAQIDLQPDSTAGDISSALELDKSTISRLILGMEKNDLIAISRGENDARTLTFSIRPKGKEALHRHDKFNETFVKTFLLNISDEEKTRLASMLKVFADGEGAQQIRLRKNENSMLLEMRRLAYAHGIINGSFLGSGVASLDWQILTEIAEAQDLTYSAQLVKKLGIKPNTLSQRITKLENEGKLVKRPLGGKRQGLELTAAGKEALQKIEALAVERFSRALAPLGPEGAQVFVELFKKYLGLTKGSKTLQLQPQLEIKVLDSEQERGVARILVVKEALKDPNTTTLPEIVLAGKNLILGLYRNGVMVGAAEVERGNEFAILQRIAVSDENPPRLLKEFLEGIDALALQYFKQKLNRSALPISP